MTMKNPEQFRELFWEPKPLSEEIGRKLAEWAKGGSPVNPLLDAGRAAARSGLASLQTWWKTLSAAQQKPLKTALDGELKVMAALADKPPVSQTDVGDAHESDVDEFGVPLPPVRME
jgi:hypothetical protein